MFAPVVLKSLRNSTNIQFAALQPSPNLAFCTKQVPEEQIGVWLRNNIILCDVVPFLCSQQQCSLEPCRKESTVGQLHYTCAILKAAQMDSQVRTGEKVTLHTSQQVYAGHQSSLGASPGLLVLGMMKVSMHLMKASVRSLS